jgi:hypothetical protein
VPFVNLRNGISSGSPFPHSDRPLWAAGVRE